MKTIEIKKVDRGVIFSHTAVDNNVRHTIEQYIKLNNHDEDFIIMKKEITKK